MHTVGLHHVCHDIGRHASYGFSAVIECQRTLSVRYFITLSQQMLTAVKLVADDNFVFSRTAYWHIMHATHSNCSEWTLNFTPFINIAFNLTAQQWSLLITRFRHSHISMSISCKSARLKKSSSIWLKSHEVGNCIRVKRCGFVFFCFTR